MIKLENVDSADEMIWESDTAEDNNEENEEEMKTKKNKDSEIDNLKKIIEEELLDPGYRIKTEIVYENSSETEKDLINLENNSANEVLSENDTVEDNNEENEEEIKTKKNKEQTDTTTNSEEDKLVVRRGLGPMMRHNSLKLLENSTMFLFQYSKSRYICVCCKEHFININSLREHALEEHTIEDLEKTIKLHRNIQLKAEISSLYCKICNEKELSIEDLRQHLIEKHKIKFGTSGDLLIPFKIETEGFRCQICSENFHVFRLLSMHVNKHYKNQVCHICGSSFSNLVFLNLHKSRVHKVITCTICDVTFEKRTDKKEHDASVHNVKSERKPRFPCPECDERFLQENLKIKHLIEKHGMKKPEHKCQLCNKAFITKSLCNNHVKCVHMKQKKHACDLCDNVFYTKFDVTRHRVIHTGEKKFTCSLCNTSFTTKDSLKRHIKRTHKTI